jgi:hypothetical protein
MSPVTREVAREICLRMGSKAILVGSIASLGSHYLVGLEAIGCASGDSLAKGQAETVNKEGVVKALDGLATIQERVAGQPRISPKPTACATS